MARSASLYLMALAGLTLSASASAGEFVLDFGPEEIIKADGNDIVVPGYSVPSFVDWNNDGLQDLVVGEGGAIGTVTPAKVRVYLNRGTEVAPLFKDYFYVRAGNQELTLTPEGCMGCFPRVVDWDEDGRKDLLVGVSDGTVRIYMNINDDNEPRFDSGKNLKVGPEGTMDMDVGKRPTPIVVDWNNDGMLDIVSGAWDGYIHVFYNCGCGGYIPPRFSTTFTPVGLIVQENGRDLMVPGTRSSPVVMDFDGDGKKDLLTGSTDGTILLYRNLGTESLPMFSGYSLVRSNGQPIDLPSNQRSRPFVCHWTGAKDGYWDLLVGYGDGKIRLYRGIPKMGDFDSDGILDGPDFTILARALDKPIPAEGSAADLNKDGFVDVLDLRLFADLWLAERGIDKK